MGSRGVTETIGIPGSGLSYSNRSSSGPALLIGLVFGVLAGLFVYAAKGSRLAQVALAALALIALILWVIPRAKRDDTSHVQQAELAPPTTFAPIVGEARRPRQSPTSILSELPHLNRCNRSRFRNTPL